MDKCYCRDSQIDCRQGKINHVWMAKITLNPDYEAEEGPGQRAATHFVSC